jgi:hypothetical protein
MFSNGLPNSRSAPDAIGCFFDAVARRVFSAGKPDGRAYPENSGGREASASAAKWFDGQRPAFKIVRFVPIGGQARPPLEESKAEPLNDQIVY